ncbi:hypothetical protein M422DRAFT_775591 [Sphaerobolus stellatus SS14]|nr:hypothetical protein M422DRAFT_775591 [Sphaerobolus stellatus SS14]
MSDFKYASIPSSASPLEEHGIKNKHASVSITTPSLFEPQTEESINPPTSPISGGAKQGFSNILLSSVLQLPSLPETSTRDGGRLLSAREPLAIQATTVNFRRFVARSGPVFWLQDRLEEVIMWRKGWKVTCTWMTIYAFLCYFPKLFLLLPHLALVSILLSTHDSSNLITIGPSESPTQVEPPPLPKEGSTDWFTNLQGIQNLMGTVSNAYDVALPWVPLLTWKSPYTHNLLTIAVVSMILLLPLVIYVPMRPVLLTLGLGPIILCHPMVLRVISALVEPTSRTWRPKIQKLIDDDNLLEHHWNADIKDVELWENERWTPATGWSKTALKAGEKPWTGGDGEWIEVLKSDFTSATISLLSNYKFIETEDWRLDYEGGVGPSPPGNNG